MVEPDKSLWDHTAGESIGAAALSGEVETEVLVIGGGYTGCSAALKLAESGTGVCLLEARTVGYGGSGRNVGLVNAGLWLEPERVESILGQRAGARLNDALAAGPAQVFSLIDEHGIDCEATRTGTLHCAHSGRGLANLKDRLRQYRARGWNVELLDPDATAGKTGTSMYRASLWDHRAGTVQPLAYARGLARAAVSAGARLFEASPVLSLEFGGDHWRAATPSGSVRSGAVVLGTNAYHQDLSHAGQPLYAPVNYFQLATAPMDEELAAGILPGRQGAWDTMTVMSSFRVDGRGRLILGAVGSLESMGRGVHRAWARRRLAALYPRLAGAEFEFGWSGRIAMTSSHVPRILKFGNRALSVHGYSGRGIGPGTVFGTAVADYLVSGEEDVLPMAPDTACRESLSTLKGIGYELGAAAFHLIHSRKLS